MPSFQSNEARSSARRSLRTAKTGTSGNTKLTGFVDTFSETDANDFGFATSIADFGADPSSANTANDASVEPAGAADGSSGSTVASISFGSLADSFGVAGQQANSTAMSGAGGEILSFYDSSSSSEITPTMLIPGTVTNATVMTKGTKGTKSTGGDGAVEAVPGVEMVGVVNGTQGVNVTGSVFGASEAVTDIFEDDAFAAATTDSFFGASGEVLQDSTSVAGPTQDGESDVAVDVFGFTNATSEDIAESFAVGILNITGSANGAGAATFDNTTSAP